MGQNPLDNPLHPLSPNLFSSLFVWDLPRESIFKSLAINFPRWKHPSLPIRQYSLLNFIYTTIAASVGKNFHQRKTGILYRRCYCNLDKICQYQGWGRSSGWSSWKWKGSGIQQLRYCLSLHSAKFYQAIVRFSCVFWEGRGI